MLFTVELDNTEGLERIFIYLDSEGLEYLMKELEHMRRGRIPDHWHLKTESWNGCELTETRLQSDLKLVNNLEIEYLPDNDDGVQNATS